MSNENKQLIAKWTNQKDRVQAETMQSILDELRKIGKTLESIDTSIQTVGVNAGGHQ